MVTSCRGCVREWVRVRGNWIYGFRVRTVLLSLTPHRLVSHTILPPLRRTEDRGRRRYEGDSYRCSCSCSSSCSSSCLLHHGGEKDGPKTRCAVCSVGPNLTSGQASLRSLDNGPDISPGTSRNPQERLRASTAYGARSDRSGPHRQSGGVLHVERGRSSVWTHTGFMILRGDHSTHTGYIILDTFHTHILVQAPLSASNGPTRR